MRERHGVTVKRLAEAVRARDIQAVRALLDARPELVHMDMAATNEHRALHYAVLDRAPEMVRLLMARGADARKGIYPHRDATSALSIATDRGYAEIVSIIEEEEQRRETARDRPVGSTAHDSEDGPLTSAVKHDQPDVLSQLLDAGLDPNERPRIEGLEPPEFSAGMPLWHATASGKLEIAEIVIVIQAVGAAPPFTSTLRRMENAEKREISLSQFRSKDGTTFSPRLTKARQVTVTATDIVGKKHEVTRAWAP